MNYNKLTNQYEFVTYIPPGPQQFCFWTINTGDTRMRKIIVKPRS